MKKTNIDIFKDFGVTGRDMIKSKRVNKVQGKYVGGKFHLEYNSLYEVVEVIYNEFKKDTYNNRNLIFSEVIEKTIEINKRMR